LFVSASARFGDAARFDRYVQLYRQRRESGAAPQGSRRYLYCLAEFAARVNDDLIGWFR
jgi:hypothetical protein